VTGRGPSAVTTARSELPTAGALGLVDDDPDAVGGVLLESVPERVSGANEAAR